MVNGNLLFFDLTCRCGRAPQLGIAPQDLLFFPVILGHRGLHERPERARVDLLPFVDVDRPPRVAFQAGIEEARWVRDPCSPGERELHDLLVRFPGADNPVVRPDRNHPLPLLGHLGVGFQDQRPHAGQSLPAPSPQVADPLVDEPGCLARTWPGLRACLRRGLGGRPGWLACTRGAPGLRLHLDPPCRTLRHLVAYGNTNKYRPVSRSKASGSSGE